VRRLVLYAAGVCGALAVAEGAFRVLEPEISASTNRLATKAALLEKQGRVEVLFFGTSRLWDAVAPRIFVASFPGTRGFSLATTSAKLDTLEWMAARFAHRPGLRLAVVEVSGPQLDAAPDPQPPPAGIEALAARSLKLIAHRAALRGESLERLPVLLLFPRKMDGSEIRVADQLEALLERPAPNPRAIDARPAAVAPSITGPGSRALRMLAVGRRMRDAGAQVVFVLPPILPSGSPEDEVTPVAACLAREFPVWDYRRVTLPKEAWRDSTHLNAAGRALFTRALAEETARAGLLEAVAGGEN
jgi:hypothetical protein